MMSGKRRKFDELGRGNGNGDRASMHDERPSVEHEDSEVSKEILEAAVRISESDYAKYVMQLVRLVVGKKVVATEGGRSGYLLFLEEHNWIICYFDGESMRWCHGVGEPVQEQRDLIHSAGVGDGKGSLTVDLPYASEECDVEKEVLRSIGHTVTGYAVGDACFNLCFEDGHELDAMIVPDDNYKRALRIFWEQW